MSWLTATKKNSFSDCCEGMCEGGTLWLVSCGRRKQNSTIHMFHSGWGFIHKFHSRCPSLVGDPEDHKLNAKISKGRVSLNPPSARLVITLWNRKIHPRRATRLSASINFSNINYNALQFRGRNKWRGVGERKQRQRSKRELKWQTVACGWQDKNISVMVEIDPSALIIINRQSELLLSHAV